jgi:L-idonate 5-dehydrogenase
VAVDVVHGGICGSDLHYVSSGAAGASVIREPLVLGHEVVGRVRAAGEGTGAAWVPGTPVAVHPATPCGRCPECLAGRRNVCRRTRYLGSAAHLPHVQGGFTDVLVVPAAQVLPLPPGLGLRLAALTEPLSVALHAVSRAGDVAGRRVLVTGAGPIGLLVVAVLASRGAAEVVVSDLVEEAMALGLRGGATGTARAGSADVPVDVDVAVEASGSSRGLAACLGAVRRGGTVVQLGLLPLGDVPFPGSALVTHEVDLRGAFRFDAEFPEALDLLAGGLPVGPVITHTAGLDDLPATFALAADRTVASKVLLDFSA